MCLDWGGGGASCDGLAPSHQCITASYLVNAGMGANAFCDPGYKGWMDLLKLIMAPFNGLHATISCGCLPD